MELVLDAMGHSAAGLLKALTYLALLLVCAIGGMLAALAVEAAIFNRKRSDDHE